MATPATGIPVIATLFGTRAPYALRAPLSVFSHDVNRVGQCGKRAVGSASALGRRKESSMCRTIVLVVNATILLTAVALPFTMGIGHAQPTCKPVKGHIISEQLTGPACTSLVDLCTSGRFIGGINGDFVFIATSLTPLNDPLVPGVVHYRGDITISTRHGDIFDKDAGAFNAAPGSTGDVGSVSTITGGTGRYAGASGHIHIAGTFTSEEGGDSDYQGILCTQ